MKTSSRHICPPVLAVLCLAGAIVLGGCGSKEADGAAEAAVSKPCYTLKADPHAAEVEDLLKNYDGDPNALDGEGRPLAISVFRSGRPYLLRGLIERGAGIDIAGKRGSNKLVLLASGVLEVDAVRLLLERGAAQVPEAGPLHVAVINADTDGVRRLLEQGCDVEARDCNGRTAIYWAAAGGQVEIMRLLIDKGAEFRQEDNNGFKVMHYAAASGNPEAIALLLEKGVSAREAGMGGTTPLHAAAGSCNPEAVRFLIAQGAEVDAKNGAGATPLMWAAQSGDVGSASLLVENGADIHVRDGRGKGLLHVAAGAGRAEMVRYLLECGADVNAKDRSGNTPLHEAVEEPHIVSLLLGHGADTSIRNEYGRTPAHCANMMKDCAAKTKTLQLLQGR